MFDLTFFFENGDKINLKKRYSDLLKFYKKIKKSFSFVILPSFPPKNFFMISEKHIKNRILGLNIFFKKLLSNSVLKETNFLEILENIENLSITPPLDYLKEKTGKLLASFESNKLVVNNLSYWNKNFEKLELLNKILKNIKNNVTRKINMDKKKTKISFVLKKERILKNNNVFEQLESLQQIIDIILNDIKSFKNCIERFFNNIKIDFPNIVFLNQNIDLFQSFSKFENIPEKIKKEVFLLEKQFIMLLKDIEFDVGEILKNHNMIFK